MIRPAYLPMKANRFTDLSVILRFDGLDLTGKTLVGQIRPSPNDKTGPVVDLPTVTDPATAGFRLISTGMTSVIALFIPRASLTVFSSSEADDDVYLSWDFQIRDSQGTRDVLGYGPFILRAGVTQ